MGPFQLQGVSYTSVAHHCSLNFDQGWLSDFAREPKIELSNVIESPLNAVYTSYHVVGLCFDSLHGSKSMSRWNQYDDGFRFFIGPDLGR